MSDRSVSPSPVSVISARSRSGFSETLRRGPCNGPIIDNYTRRNYTVGPGPVGPRARTPSGGLRLNTRCTRLTRLRHRTQSAFTTLFWITCVIHSRRLPSSFSALPSLARSINGAVHVRLYRVSRKMYKIQQRIQH